MLKTIRQSYTPLHFNISTVLIAAYCIADFDSNDKLSSKLGRIIFLEDANENGA